LAVVPGSRSIENVEEILQQVYDRTEGREDVLFTSDEYAAYGTAIDHVYGVAEEPKPAGTPGRPAVVPERQLPAELKYATAHRERREGRVVSIVTAVLVGTWQSVVGALERSSASRTINTSFVKLQHLTDRHHNARKSRKTYRFSKDWRMHEAMTYLTMYSYTSAGRCGCSASRSARGHIERGRRRWRRG
jgi:hypothetical protein